MNLQAINNDHYHPNLGVSMPDLDPLSLREKMIEEYTPLIKSVANRMAMRLPPHISVNDLFGAGAIGLIDALDKFDPTKGVQFNTYAAYRIKGAMLDELRSLDWASRSVRKKVARIEKAIQTLEKKKGRSVEDEEVAEEMGISLEEYYEMLQASQGVSFLDFDSAKMKFSRGPEEDLSDGIMDEKENNPLRLLDFKEMKKVLTQAIEDLPLKEKTILALYYHEELNLKEIGAVLNYTESRICQLHTKAILKLRVKLKGYFKDSK